MKSHLRITSLCIIWGLTAFFSISPLALGQDVHTQKQGKITAKKPTIKSTQKIAPQGTDNTSKQIQFNEDTTPVSPNPSACQAIIGHTLTAERELPGPAQAPRDEGAPDSKPHECKPDECREPPIKVTTLNDSGRQETGPGTVELLYGNKLRFDLAIGAKSTATDAPTIPAQLAANAASQAVKQPAPNNAKITSTNEPATILLEQIFNKPPEQQFNDRWNEYNNCYVSLLDQAQKVEDSINNAISKINDITASYTNVLKSYTSPVIRAVDIAGMQTSAKNAFDGYTKYVWPEQSVQTALDDIKTFQLKYALLPAENGYGKWINDENRKQAFNAISTNLPQLITELQGVRGSSDTASKFRDAQSSADSWRLRFNRISQFQPDDFIVTSDYISCKTWFGASQTNVINLAYRDLADPKATKDTVSELLTVNCYSRLTISTGAGFTTVGDHKPDFVPDPKNAANQVLGFTSDSTIRPFYALQTNFSLWRPRDRVFELHGTLGAALGASNDSTATLGFLFGPSFSFHQRTFFITPAFHLGQESVFQDGFHPGDPKGALTSPPTVTHWRPAFALAITFPTSK